VQAGEGRRSYDELAALVIEQARVIAELRARVAALEAENAELKRRLGMTSANSVVLWISATNPHRSSISGRENPVV
jgi:hypothetical protein